MYQNKVKNAQLEPCVYVIVLNWNRAEDSLECIASLRESTYANCQIVVVDNGSSDDSVEQIRERGGDLTLLETGENLGYTGGNNWGIKYAVDQQADYVFVLNNDTFVEAEAISKMVQVAEADEQIGVVTCKILNYPDRDVIWFGGSKYDTRYMIARHVGYGAKDIGQFDTTCDIPWATGCALFMRRTVIESVGLLYEGFFLTAEDLDICLRVREKGYRIVYLPTAVIWHKEAISSGGQDAPQYIYYQTRNLILLHTRHASCRMQLVVSHLYALLVFLKRTLQLLKAGKWRSILGVLYGMGDGFAGLAGRKDYALLAPHKKL